MCLADYCTNEAPNPPCIGYETAIHILTAFAWHWVIVLSIEH